MPGESEAGNQDELPEQVRGKEGAGSEAPIAQVGDRAGRPQLPVLRAEAVPSPLLSYRLKP